MEQFRVIRSHCGRTAELLLVNAGGSFLSKFQFISVFGKGIRSQGLNAFGYSGYFFRTRVAIEAATLGLGDYMI